MQRAQRAFDNPALDTAIEIANILNQPVVVFLAPVASHPSGKLRHYRFLFDGFSELGPSLARRRVGLVFRHFPNHRLVPFCNEVGASLIIGDENPLRYPAKKRGQVAAELHIPFWTVDADVVVPTRMLQKEHYAARTIRPRIHAHLKDFLVPGLEPTARRLWRPPSTVSRLRVSSRIPDCFPLDRSVGPVSGYRGGTQAGQRMLQQFITQRLTNYATGRNHPELDLTSQLSPYLRFGHLGPRAVALAVNAATSAPIEVRAALIEQLIVRRELAINYVHFNQFYDSLKGCEPWALRTLDSHRGDPRTPCYTEQQLESAETHDPLWNAAQRQMVARGWMHGYLRMYWAKKILEWTPTPEEGLGIAIRLNDRYELDGSDPNGYAGIAWAIGGKHDRAWGPERPVYGKIRYMSYASTSRKFGCAKYIDQWSPPSLPRP